MNRFQKQQYVQTRRPYITSQTMTSLTETEMDKLVSEVESEAARHELQASVNAADFALTQLKIVRDGHMRNTPTNWNIIRRTLGSFYSLEQFREAIKDESFKRSLTWDREPFAEVVREEQHAAAAQQTRRRQFSAVVKTLSTVNVADNDANYRLCCSQLEDLLAAHAITEQTFIANLTEALLANYITGLVKNDSETTQNLDMQNRQALITRLEKEHRLSGLYAGAVRRMVLTESTVSELRERASLLAEISEKYSPDRNLNATQFCSLFVSVKSNAEYRDQLDLARERKRLAQMSPQQIKDENQRVRQVNTTIDSHESDTTPDGFQKLRQDSKWNNELVTKQLLWKVSKEDVARLLRIYGKSQLDDRIRNGIITPVAVQEN
jgi:hypothetical protein